MPSLWRPLCWLGSLANMVIVSPPLEAARHFIGASGVHNTSTEMQLLRDGVWCWLNNAWVLRAEPRCLLCSLFADVFSMKLLLWER